MPGKHCYKSVIGLNCTLGYGVFETSAGWGLRVADYRAFTVGDDGHFTGFEPFVCADDVEAIEKAKRLVGSCDVELWCGDRLVIRLEAKSSLP